MHIFVESSSMKYLSHFGVYKGNVYKKYIHKEFRSYLFFFEGEIKFIYYEK